MKKYIIIKDIIMLTSNKFLRIQFQNPIVLQLCKINCNLPSFRLQLNITNDKAMYNDTLHIPYMDINDPMHSQK